MMKMTFDRAKSDTAKNSCKRFLKARAKIVKNNGSQISIKHIKTYFTYLELNIEKLMIFNKVYFLDITYYPKN